MPASIELGPGRLVVVGTDGDDIRRVEGVARRLWPLAAAAQTRPTKPALEAGGAGGGGQIENAAWAADPAEAEPHGGLGGVGFYAAAIRTQQASTTVRGTA